MAQYHGNPQKGDKHYSDSQMRGKDSIEYGIQGGDGMTGERRERSDNRGKGESMDGPYKNEAITRGEYQSQSNGSIYRDGQGGRKYESESKQTKGLYPAQKNGRTNGVVGNKMNAMSSGPSMGGGKKKKGPQAGGSMNTGTESKTKGGVYPAQAKGYRGSVKSKGKHK